jgi:hypothetical protein
MSEKIKHGRGKAISEEVFIPVGEMLLIRTEGYASILDVLRNDGSITMGMNCFIAGIGDKVNASAEAVLDSEEMYCLGDEVVLHSSEEHALSRVVIPNAERTIAWYKKNENSPELVIAGAVLKDKARSKMALNNSEILAGVNASAGIINTGLNAPKTKHELFANKEVKVIAYYTTNKHNIAGLYAEYTKQAE